MLAFSISDLKGATSADALGGLRILPLASGSVVPLGSCRPILASAAEQSLLGDAPDSFVHPCVHEALRGREAAQERAVLRAVGVQPFSADLLATRLAGRVLPEGWCGRSEIPAVEAAPVLAGPHLQALWRFIAGGTGTSPDGAAAVSDDAEVAKRCAALQQWPLLPHADGRLLDLAHREATLPPGVPTDAALCAALCEIGCPQMHPDYADATLRALGALPPDGPDEADLEPAYIVGRIAALRGTVPTPCDASAHVLLEYLAASEAMLVATPSAVAAMRSLAIFPLVGGLRGSIAPGARTFPANACGGSFCGSGTRFLEYSEHLLPLYRLLGVAVLTEVELMQQCILPGFDALTPVERERALQWLWDNWALVRPQLLEQLRDTVCIPTEANTLALPRECVDPSVELFRLAHAEDHFPSQRIFAGRQSFLSDLGVRRRVDERTFLEVGRPPFPPRLLFD